MATVIQDLTPELVVKIFSHFIESEGHMRFSKNVVPVCTTWRNISMTPSLWKDIRVKNWKYEQSLSERGLLHNTQSLKISDDYAIEPNYISRIDPDRLLAVLSKIGDLKTLEISNNIIRSQTMTIIAKCCPNLEHLHMENVSSSKYGKITFEELEPVLTKCGQKLKHLNFTHCLVKDSERLIAEIAAKCPSLEVFEWRYQYRDPKIPIYKLVSGCPKLQKLELCGCVLVTSGGNDCLGFKNLTLFKAYICDFYGLDLYSLLKDSNHLEYLHLDWIHGLVLSDVSKIASNKVKSLNVRAPTMDLLTSSISVGMDVMTFEQLVDKWKHTLSHLQIVGLRRDITSILRIYLAGNRCRKLEMLWIDQRWINQSFLKIFIQNCPNFKELKLENPRKYYGNREEIMNFCDSL